LRWCPPSPYTFNLPTLQLLNVQIASETLDFVLSACTFLENLNLISVDGLTHVDISNQNCQLKRIAVLDPQSSCRVVIVDASNLGSPLYGGNLLDLSFAKEAPRLTQPGLISSCYPTPLQLGLDWRELFLKISHIEILNLSVPLVHWPDKSRWQSGHG